ncbi:MAG: hypothetical protein ABI899_12615 [Actinomycetota bacterium]
MRSPLPASLRDATTAPQQELVLPRGRRAVPTRSRLRTRRIPVAIYVAVSILVPTLIVVGFMSAGLWANAESSSVTQVAEAGTPSGESGVGVAAPASPADVKGSMTVQQVVDAFSPISAAQILGRLGAPLDTPTSTQLKTLVEKGNSIDIPTLRTWLQDQGAN